MRLCRNITLFRAYGLHAASAKLRLRGPQWLPAELAGRAIQGESVMVNRIWVGLLQPGDSLVFCQHWPKTIARSNTLGSE
jgi:hypothetical protein